MEVKTVKTNKSAKSSQKMAQKWHCVSLLYAFLSQAWNWLLRYFQCLKSSAGSCRKRTQDLGQLHLYRPSYGHLKRVFYPKIEANMPIFSNPFSNTHISGLEWSFAKIQNQNSKVWHWLAPEKGEGISPNLVKIACLCSNACFSGMEFYKK